jgi:hypothetical protein
VIVPPAIDVTAPTKACGRVKGIETRVSELLKQEVEVKPTGSVTTVCAPPDEATIVQPNERIRVAMRRENGEQ